MRNWIPISLILVTVNLWLISKNNLGDISGNWWLSLSQIAALIGLVLMSWVLVLSTRLGLIEEWHKGLDKNYQKHHWWGEIAFMLMLNHPILLVVSSIPNWQLAQNYLIPGNFLPYNLGIFGIYSMIAGFIFIVFIKLPYDKWKISHKLMGIAFLFGAWHTIVIGSDIGRSLPLRIWILTMDAIGVMSFIYTQFLYKFIGPRYQYKIEKIERNLDVIKIFMLPEGRKMTYQPGQFGYFEFEDRSVGKETHPFSFTSDPNREELSIGVKISGDYTLKMPGIKVGSKVKVWGPYGRFYLNQTSGINQVWVAGGIGITPFISLLKNRISKPEEGRVSLFYLVKNATEAVFAEEIEKLVEGQGWIKFYPWYSDEQGRLDVKTVKSLVDGAVESRWFVCGPEKMMNSIKDQLDGEGVGENRFNWENFNLLG